jgi:hypothetical protein
VLLGSIPKDEPVPCGATLIEPWSCLGYDGVRIRSARWDICTTIQIPTLHKRLPVALETALAAMRDTLDSPALTLPEPRETMTTCLMSDRRQWTNLARMLLPEHAASMQGLSRGGFTADGVALLYDIDQRPHCRNTIALALHEGWHQYVQTAFRGGLPAWADEGLATVMEGYRLLPDGLEINHDANRQRKRRAWWLLRRDRMQPLAAFVADDPHAAMARGRSELLNYYAQAWAYMRFMLADEHRTEQIRRMLGQAVRGQRVVVVTPTETDNAAFLQWCTESLQPTWWP